MEEINASIGFDQKLFAQDILGSKAHARMLAAKGIISKKDASAILKGLDEIEAEIRAGKFKFSRALEDIHMNVESRLKDLIGSAAGRLHTARSRNDQVATLFRMWLRDAMRRVADGVFAVIESLTAQAAAHPSAVMPGKTHLQAAQPVLLAHHLRGRAHLFCHLRQLQ